MILFVARDQLSCFATNLYLLRHLVSLDPIGKIAHFVRKPDIRKIQDWHTYNQQPLISWLYPTPIVTRQFDGIFRSVPRLVTELYCESYIYRSEALVYDSKD